jgi:hypothetical protein
MDGAAEYVVAAGAVAAYETLASVVREQHLEVVKADARHRTLAFRPGGSDRSDRRTIHCAVLDAGHGLSKFVMVGLDGQDAAPVGLAGYPESLFAIVEQRLRLRPAVAGRKSALARP